MTVPDIERWGGRGGGMSESLLSRGDGRATAPAEAGITTDTFSGLIQRSHIGSTGVCKTCTAIIRPYSHRGNRLKTLKIAHNRAVAHQGALETARFRGFISWYGIQYQTFQNNR